MMLERNTMKLFTALALCMLLPALPVYAGHTGPYLGGYAGGTLPMEASASHADGSFTMEFKPGLQWGATIGWDLGEGNLLGGEGRVELEYNRRVNRLDRAGFSDSKNIPGSGELTVDSLLLSSYYVHHTKSRWSPYIGLGLGTARIEASNLQVTGSVLSRDTDTVFAYQFGTGIDLELNSSFSLDLGYRFQGITRPHLAEPDGRKFTMEYFTHGVMLGARWGF